MKFCVMLFVGIYEICKTVCDGVATCTHMYKDSHLKNSAKVSHQKVSLIINCTYKVMKLAYELDYLTSWQKAMEHRIPN